MNKKAYFFVVCFLLWASLGWAETVTLKTGKIIAGKIIQRTTDEIKMDIQGVTVTYFLDEIEKIDGEMILTSPPTQAPPAALPEGSSFPPAAPTAVSALPESLPSGVPSVDPSLANLDKHALIIRFIEASGTRQSMEQMLNQIISQSDTQEAENLKNLFDINEIVEVLVPIYDKHYKEEELRELITFYNSQAGRKYIEVTPQIMEDSLRATMLYFQAKMTTPSSLP